MPMNFLKQAGYFMSRGNEAPLSELNPSLANVIEDTILFGRMEEFDMLTDLLVDHPQVSSDLRCGLEALKLFRKHYNAPDMDLSPEARQRVNQFDTSWSMRLIDMVREGSEEATVVDFEQMTA